MTPAVPAGIGVSYSGTDEHKAALARVLASKLFSEAPTLKKLLEYSAQKTKEGTISALTQRGVFFGVFGDKGDISKVAATANRLRQHLDNYYKTEDGRGDPLRLNVPRGSYLLVVQNLVEIDDFADVRDTNHGIAPNIFQHFVESLSIQEGVRPEARDARTRRWVETSRFSGTVTLPEDGAFKSFFTYLARSGEQLTFTQMRRLTETIGIHSIMLDPLLSEPVDAEGIVLDLPTPRATAPMSAHGHFTRVGGPRQQSYGEAAHYAIPTKRLAGTDAAFVYLVLGPSGHSDAHHHPGDELLLVLEGRVEVHLIDSGLSVELNAGGYAHFFAEQNHSARNLSSIDFARVFIIRFYQLGGHDTRQEMRRELWDVISEVRPGKMRRLNDLTWGWILEAAADRPRPPARTGEERKIPAVVQNPLGLARLLSKLPAPRVKAFRQRIARTPSITDWLWRVQTNQISVPVQRLPEIAELFGAFDLLLCEFIFPSSSRQVIVCREPDARRHDWADMGDVADELPSTRLAQGVKYEIPRRSLACSDVAITWLTLDPMTNTNYNRHPGCELLMPMKGSVSVERRNAGWICHVSTDQVAHYDSDTDHRVVNRSSEQAEMFLIRFFGEDREKKLRQTNRYSAKKERAGS
jgi:quercetin dioxygenase-like cupin family protein